MTREAYRCFGYFSLEPSEVAMAKTPWEHPSVARITRWRDTDLAYDAGGQAEGEPALSVQVAVGRWVEG